MKIVGYQTNSFIDFPGKIAYVVFTAGCNMDCWYCHNKTTMNSKVFIPEDAILGDIKSRAGFIEGVVISGGEPALQPDLPQFAQKIKDMELAVKLDTNGTAPQLLKSMLDVVDYVAMDIKAPFKSYKSITNTDDDTDAVKESIRLLTESGIPYEFRTTFSPDLKIPDIEEIARSIAGARLYAVQQFVPREDTPRVFFSAHSPDYIREAAKKASVFVRTVTRGI